MNGSRFYSTATILSFASVAYSMNSTCRYLCENGDEKDILIELVKYTKVDALVR